MKKIISQNGGDGAPSSKPIDKLFYPKDLVDDVGLSKHGIAFLKKKGCRFYGRKTCIRWIRDHLNYLTSVVGPSEQLSQHP